MSDLTTTAHSGDIALRLVASATGRFRLVLDAEHRPGWVASFGRDAIVDSVRETPDGLEFSFRPSPGVAVGDHGELVMSARVTFGAAAGRAPESVVTLRLSGPTGFPMSEYSGPTIVPRPDGSLRDEWRYLLPDGEGLWMRTDGTGHGARERLVFHEHRISLPMAAMVHDAGAGIMVTGVGGNDHAVDFVIGDDDEQLSGLRLVNFASLGAWHHDVSWVIAVSPDGGAETLAVEVGAQLREQGIPLRTQSEKLAGHNVPERVRGSVGGTILWCHFDSLTAELIGDLQAAGVEALMVMGRPADPAAASALAASPYAGGPYFQTYDVFPPGSVEELGWRGVYPPEGATAGWPEDLIHDREGWLNSGWRYVPFADGDRFWETEEFLDEAGRLATRSRAVHDYTTVQTYRRCPSRHLHVVVERGIPMLESLGATAVFYDIATAMYGLECYAPDHPVHRIEDIEYRKEILTLLGSSGRLVHSEAGKWWAIDLVDTFEGLFSYDWEFNIGSIQLEDYPVNARRREFEFNLEHRLPFFGMVAGHAIARTMWWGTGQDRHAETWPSNNAITALYGANPIYVVDPDHPLVPGSERWEAFLASTRSFDVLKREAGDSRIASYQTDGPHLGRTVFDNGVSVEANVGLETHGGLGPGEYVIKGADGAELARVTPRA